jgi:hypothetical protein
MSPEAGRFSFDELGSMISAYEAAAEPYGNELYVRAVYFNMPRPTTGGQRLAEWKQQFPLADARTMANLEIDYDNAREELVGKLGLESTDSIRGLARAFRDEQRRRNQQEEQAKLPEYYNALYHWGHSEPSEFIGDVITMAKITGGTYRVRESMIMHNTHYYAFAKVGPTHELEDVLAEFREQGMEINQL